jgi:hypothetical protein
MFWVSSYYLKPEKTSAYQQWLLSPEAKTLTADAERETGMKYVGTYWTVLGFGDFDCEDWWEVPSWAAFDALRDSQATEKLFMRTWELDFTYNSRSAQQRMLRTTEDIRTYSPPQKSDD